MTRSVFALALLSACITGRPPQRAPQPTTVAMAILLDREDGSTARAPEALAQQVARGLATRNLVAGAPLDSLTAPSERRTTQARLQDLARRAQGAPVVLLVEARIIFDEVLDVKYRWSVYVKATIAKTNDLASALTQQSTYPAFLDFDHEREPEAAAAVAQQITDQTTRLADDLIADMSPAHASLAPGKLVHGDSIYFVLVDRFANGDPSNDGAIDHADPQAFHGGDLQGVLDHLDDLQRLGVGAVWLSPVFQMRTEKLLGHGAFHGYWVDDFTRIEPRFGDAALLARLSEELHHRGMKLYLDVVLNHVAYDAPLTKARPDWFHHNGDIRDWNDPKQLETFDVHGLPDLAQEREDVYAYLLQTSLHWIDSVHPDGFRLDAVKHISPAFWARYNDDILRHTGPGFLLLGEDLDGHVPDLARTLQDGHFTSLFDFPLHFAMVDVFCKGASPEKLAAVLFEDRRYPHPEALATLLDNHDLPRITSACGGDLDRVREALTFLLTTRGRPTLTYGTEVPLTGAGEPENRGDMVFDGGLTGLLQTLLHARTQLADLVQQPCTSVLSQDAFACVKAQGPRALIIAVNHSGQPLSIPMPLSSVAITDVTTGVGTSASQPYRVAPGATQALLVEAAAPAAIESWMKTLGRIGATTPVTFAARGAPLLAGDRLYLTGSGEELGDWTPEKGIGFDRALSAEARLPASGIFEAKLVIRRADGTTVWEDGRNRYIYDTAGGTKRCLQWSHGDCTVT